MPKSGRLAARLSHSFLALALLAPPAWSQTGICSDLGILASQTLSDVGAGQRNVEAADLNGDGIADLVISTSLGVTVALGQTGPSGTATYAIVFTSGSMPDAKGTAIADFDRDGIPDLAVASFSNGSGLYVLRGLGANGIGTGQFAAPVKLTSDAVWDVAAVDLNGDGAPDLVTGTNGAQLLTFRNNGNGTFGLTSQVAANIQCKGLVVADLDQDGIADVAVVGDKSSLAVFRGLSNSGVEAGKFAFVRKLAVPGTPYDVTVGDFDHDGIRDLATANYDGNSISVFRGFSGLGYGDPITHAAPGFPLGVAAADIDSDGRTDLVVAAAGSGGAFAYFHNTGAASGSVDGFSGSTRIGPARVGYGITVANLNGDGSPDVLLPGLDNTNIVAAFNRCLGDRPRVLTTSVAGSGSIARNPDLPQYPQGTVVQLTAVPTADAVFVHWSGDLVGNANPANVTMDFDRAVTAFFIPRQRTLTIALAGAGQGHVTRSPDLPTYSSGTTVQLTATAETGNHFVGWSGALTGVQSPVALIMDGDKSVVATFEPDVGAVPQFVSVADAPLDQGGNVKLKWSPTPFESPGADPDARITQYYVWHAITPAAAAARAAAYAQGSQSAQASQTLLLMTAAGGDYDWELVTKLPASRFAGYSYVAGTPDDSSAAGVPFAVFMVQGLNAAGTRWFSSPPDSGYSVDNLPPSTPGPFVAEYGATSNRMHWGPSHAPDLQGYRLHRGTTGDFVPGAANLIGTPTDTTFVDPTPVAYYYKLAAVDVHGNLSHFVTVSPEIPTGTLASLVSATRKADRVSITWELNEPGAPANIYRRTDDADWRLLGSHSADGRGMLAFEDQVSEPGVRYGYRLGVPDAGQEVFLAEVWVEAEALRFALDGVVPNPSTNGRFTVRLALPDEQPATLELLDVSGRRLASQRLVGKPGAQTVDLAPAGELRPGVYWVRLRHAGRERSVRVAAVE